MVLVAFETHETTMQLGERKQNPQMMDVNSAIVKHVLNDTVATLFKHEFYAIGHTVQTSQHRKILMSYILVKKNFIEFWHADKCHLTAGKHFYNESASNSQNRCTNTVGDTESLTEQTKPIPFAIS